MSSIECTLMTDEDGQCYFHCEADEELCELTRQQCGGVHVPGSVMQRPPRRHQPPMYPMIYPAQPQWYQPPMMYPAQPPMMYPAQPQWYQQPMYQEPMYQEPMYQEEAIAPRLRPSVRPEQPTRPSRRRRSGRPARPARPARPDRPARPPRPATTPAVARERRSATRSESANIGAKLTDHFRDRIIPRQQRERRRLRNIGVGRGGLNETAFHKVMRACPCVAPTSNKQCWTAKPVGDCAEAVDKYPGVVTLNRNPLARHYYRPCLQSEPNCDHKSGANLWGRPMPPPPKDEDWAKQDPAGFQEHALYHDVKMQAAAAAAEPAAAAAAGTRRA